MEHHLLKAEFQVLQITRNQTHFSIFEIPDSPGDEVIQEFPLWAVVADEDGNSKVMGLIIDSDGTNLPIEYLEGFRAYELDADFFPECQDCERLDSCRGQGEEEDDV